MDKTLRSKIIELAAGSPLMRYNWHNRGSAPSGYIKGLAVAFAQCYIDLKASDSSAKDMAKPIGNSSQDALSYYHDAFAAQDMLDSAPADILRHLFVLMYGLGMRESSGVYSEGRDTTVRNPTADSAEAGMFQQSWDSRTCSPELPKLFTKYDAGSLDCLFDVFKEGVVKPVTPNVGVGQGMEFQRHAKACPMFAVACAAVGLRNLRSAWGPINRREAEVRPEANNLLLLVQKLVDATSVSESPEPTAPIAPPPAPATVHAPSSTPTAAPIAAKPWWERVAEAIDTVIHPHTGQPIPVPPVAPSAPPPPPVTPPQPPKLPTMLILRGIAGSFNLDGSSHDYPRGALDEASATAYATKMGYVPRVLDVAGFTGADSPQVQMALNLLRTDASANIQGLYGFSGGAYNVKHILDLISPAIKSHLKLVAVIGAPDAPESAFKGTWELVYRTNPPEGHMYGPRSLLNETVAVPPPKPVLTPGAALNHDMGSRIKRTMLALYPDFWFPDQNVISVEKMNPDFSACNTGSNTFDDIKMILDGEGKVIGGPWEATTHPGKYWTIHPMNPDGAFIIALGVNECWTPGDYHGNEVWRQAEGSHIIGHRDPSCTYQRQGAPKRMGNISVHHHHGYNLPKSDIANAAAGCQVIRLNASQEVFMSITKKCPRFLADKSGYRMTATVLEAKDILP